MHTGNAGIVLGDAAPRARHMYRAGAAWIDAQRADRKGNTPLPPCGRGEKKKDGFRFMNAAPDDRGGFPKRGVRRSATISLARSGFLDYGLCILDFGLTSPIYGWRPVSRRRPTGAACHTLRRRQKSITSIFLGSNSTKVDTRQLFTAESVSWWGPSVVPQLVGLFSPRLSHERRSGVGVNRMIM